MNSKKSSRKMVKQMRRLNDIPQWEWTEVELARVIKATRQEREGISLERMGEIIAGELDYAESEGLICQIRIQINKRLKKGRQR